MLQEWYILDENDEGPSKTYVLKHLLDVNDKVFWDEVLPSLREALNGQSFDPSSPDLKVNFSVTEYEVEVCLLLTHSLFELKLASLLIFLQIRKAIALNAERHPGEPSRLLWTRRRYKEEITTSSFRHWDYNDGVF